MVHFFLNDFDRLARAFHSSSRAFKQIDERYSCFVTDTDLLGRDSHVYEMRMLTFLNLFFFVRFFFLFRNIKNIEFINIIETSVR